MARTFNCGVGAALVVSKDQTEQTLHDIRQHQEDAWVIGSVVECPEGNGSFLAFTFTTLTASALCPSGSVAFLHTAVACPYPVHHESSTLVQEHMVSTVELWDLWVLVTRTAMLHRTISQNKVTTRNTSWFYHPDQFSVLLRTHQNLTGWQTEPCR